MSENERSRTRSRRTQTVRLLMRTSHKAERGRGNGVRSKWAEAVIQTTMPWLFAIWHHFKFCFASDHLPLREACDPRFSPPSVSTLLFISTFFQSGHDAKIRNAAVYEPPRLCDWWEWTLRSFGEDDYDNGVMHVQMTRACNANCFYLGRIPTALPEGTNI